jgi:hypothetical protein
VQWPIKPGLSSPVSMNPVFCPGLSASCLYWHYDVYEVLPAVLVPVSIIKATRSAYGGSCADHAVR